MLRLNASRHDDDDDGGVDRAYAVWIDVAYLDEERRFRM